MLNHRRQGLSATGIGLQVEQYLRLKEKARNVLKLLYGFGAFLGFLFGIVWRKGWQLDVNFQNDTLYFLMPENRLFRNRAEESRKNQHVFM